MASITVTYSFSNSTVADATQVNQNFTDLVNGTSDGTKDFNIAAITAAGVATFNGNVNIGNATGDDLVITASLASNIVIKTANTYGVGAAGVGWTGIYFQSSATHTTRVVFGSGVANITWTFPGTNGTNGHVLQNNGSGTWSYVPLQTDINAVSSADYTVLDTDGYQLINVTTGNSDRTVTLPTAADNTDRVLIISKADTGTGKVIVDGEGSETINGVTAINLYKQYETITIKCDGTTWILIDARWAHGTYTPTLTADTNITASTARACQFARIGINVVTVSGNCDADPTAGSNADTLLRCSLPIASNLAAAGSNDCCGSGTKRGSTVHESVEISADATNDTAVFYWKAVESGNTRVSFTFTYLII